MKALVINGSPRGKKGLTWWMLERFIEGMEKAGASVQSVDLAGKKIHPCTGDLSCWLKTPGKCIFNDDMNEILEIFKTDINALILGTPVYVDGMTGLMKNAVDRMVPIADPRIKFVEGHCRHVQRYKGASVLALVSVCGFFERDNFDPIIAHAEAIARNLNAKFGGAVVRPSAPAIEPLTLFAPLKIRRLSKAVESAGSELIKNGTISDSTLGDIAADLMSKEDYVKRANESFEKILAKIPK